MNEVTIPLVGEPLAVDLANTRFCQPTGEPVDLLAADGPARAWLATQRHRLRTPVEGFDLAALRALRDQVADAIDCARFGTAPPEAALVALTQAQRAAPQYRLLSWDGERVIATPRRTADPTVNLLAELAEAAAALLTDPAVRNVRQCEGPHCRLVFLPAHPRRRWCSPTLCGNRARVARYYRRHKP